MEKYQKRWEDRFGFMKTKKNKILELGSYQGEMSKWFSDMLLNHKHSKLICVDTWKGSVEYNEDFKENEKIFKRNIKDSKNYEKIEIKKMTTTKYFLNFFNEIKKPYFNLIYIDACHDARCVLSDSINSFKALKVNGYIVFDDYGWKQMPKDYERPKMAINAFLNIFRDNIEIIHKGYKVIIKKKSEYIF